MACRRLMVIKTMEILTVNLTNPARHAYLNGKKYYVCDMTLIVPGVLAGSQGPLFYQDKEIARNYQQWEGVPLTAYHPYANGRNVSAKHPGVLAKQGIGIVRKPCLDPLRANALRAEGWFDVDRVKQVDPRIFNALAKGQKIELSTGLFTDNEPAAPGASFNGRTYAYVAKNYRPDHVAILPDQVGACSIVDGCGVFNSQSGKYNGCSCANCRGDDDKGCES